MSNPSLLLAVLENQLVGQIHPRRKLWWSIVILVERYIKDTRLEKAAAFGLVWLVGKDAVRSQVSNPGKALIEKVGTRQLRGFRDFLIGDLRLILPGGDGFDRLYLIIVELDFDRGILVTAEK